MGRGEQEQAGQEKPFRWTSEQTKGQHLHEAGVQVHTGESLEERQTMPEPLRSRMSGLGLGSVDCGM